MFKIKTIKCLSMPLLSFNPRSSRNILDLLKLPLLALILLLLFGCLVERNVSPLKKEVVTFTNEIDLDGDGKNDFGSYVYSPITTENIKTKRTVSFYADNDVTVSSFKTINDADLINTYDDITGIIEDFKRIDSACAANIGLVDVYCFDDKTCAKICSSRSIKCKNAVDEYGDIIGNAVTAYANEAAAIKSKLNEMKQALPKIREISDNERTNFIKTSNEVAVKIASLSSNPIFTQQDFSLCDYDLNTNTLTKNLKTITRKIAVYSVSPKIYKYRVSMVVELLRPETSKDVVSLDDSIAKDILPKNIEIQETSIASPQGLTVNSVGSAFQLQWSVAKTSKQKVILYYEFYSKLPPETITLQFTSPSLVLKGINIEFVQPVITLYKILFKQTKNFYLSFGSAIAISLILLLVLLNLALLLINVVRSKIAGEPTEKAVYKSFMRTHVKWKIDLISAVIAIAAGFVAMTMFADEVKKELTLFEVGNLAIENPFNFVALAGIFFGFTLFYLALENRVKVFVLERHYGKRIKEDKELFKTTANDLIAKVQELKTLVNTLTNENFDVGTEQDIAASISIERINEITKKGENAAKREIEDNVTKISEAIERLHERKKLAEENWPKWNQMIDKMFDEGQEVYVSGLIAIPASLRSWALNRYVNEHSESGLVFEGEVVKRKEVSPDKVALSMIEKKILFGAVILKGNNIVFSKIVSGSATVISVLVVKMVGYLQSTIKNLGQHDFGSLAGIGERFVIVLLKHQTINVVLIMEKEKFRQAIDEWKSKVKNV